MQDAEGASPASVILLPLFLALIKAANVLTMCESMCLLRRVRAAAHTRPMWQHKVDVSSPVHAEALLSGAGLAHHSQLGT